MDKNKNKTTKYGTKNYNAKNIDEKGWIYTSNMRISRRKNNIDNTNIQYTPFL